MTQGAKAMTTNPNESNPNKEEGDKLVCPPGGPVAYTYARPKAALGRIILHILSAVGLVGPEVQIHGDARENTFRRQPCCAAPLL